MWLINFLKSDKKFLWQWIKKWIFEICRLLPIIFFYLIPLAILIEMVYKFFWIKETDNAIFQLVETASPILFFIMAWLIGPIFEELAFRLGMVKNKNNFSIWISFFILMIWQIIFDFWEKFELLRAIFLFWTLFCFLVYFLRNFYDKNFEKIDSFYSENSNKIFWFFTLIFWLLHIFNMENFGQVWFLAPVLCLPQVLLGVILWYLRLKYSFSTSILFHILWNSFLTSSIFLAKENFSIFFTSIASLFSVMFLIWMFLNLKNLIKPKSI